MTTPDDPTDVRAAHDRVYRVSQIRTANAVIAVYGPFVGREHDYDDDRLTLSRAYLALTDPTPLTVEVLVGMGGIENPKSELCYRFGKLCVYADGLPEEWEWTYGNDGIHDVPSWLSPRTAGELRQLLRRLEPPHAAR